MPAFNKFNQLVKDMVDGVHDFDGHVFKVMLTNTTPVATNTVRSNLAEISAGNGYNAGGVTVTVTTSVTGSTAKITCSDATFQASGGPMAAFRFAVLYNDSPTSPADPLVGFWDYGQSVTLQDGETLTFDADATLGILTVAI